MASDLSWPFYTTPEQGQMVKIQEVSIFVRRGKLHYIDDFGEGEIVSRGGALVGKKTGDLIVKPSPSDRKKIAKLRQLAKTPKRTRSPGLAAHTMGAAGSARTRQPSDLTIGDVRPTKLEEAKKDAKYYGEPVAVLRDPDLTATLDIVSEQGWGDRIVAIAHPSGRIESKGNPVVQTDAQKLRDLIGEVVPARIKEGPATIGQLNTATNQAARKKGVRTDLGEAHDYSRMVMRVVSELKDAGKIGLAGYSAGYEVWKWTPTRAKKYTIGGPIRREDGSPGYRVSNVIDYSEQYVVATMAEANALKKKLEGSSVPKKRKKPRTAAQKRATKKMLAANKKRRPKRTGRWAKKKKKKKKATKRKTKRKVKRKTKRKVKRKTKRKVKRRTKRKTKRKTKRVTVARQWCIV